MYYRVVKEFEGVTARGGKVIRRPGEMVDILNRFEADKLLTQGFIVEREYSFEARTRLGVAFPTYKASKRIGIWLTTSRSYSGGRLHMYQYALCLAQLGAEVWLITNQEPIWTRDYPIAPLLKIAIESKDKIPPDFDLIVTDSKRELGKKALVYKKNHPHVPFVCFNFETPNWVAEFDKEYAGKLAVPRDTFLHADYLIANSEPSRAYLLKWLKKKIPAGVLPPAINDWALKASEGTHAKRPIRPYAVYSARGPAYKGGHVAIDAVMSLPFPFDLVVFGSVSTRENFDDQHRVYRYERHSDAEKFNLMKNAAIVLAPSKFEGFGMVPMEALASGTPCIVYDLPVLKQYYGNRLNYVKWGDEKAYKQRVLEVASDISPHKKRARKVSGAIIKDYGLEAMKRRIETLPHHAIKKSRISAHCIAFWGFCPEAVEAVYPHVHEIVIAYGPTELNKDVKPDDSLKLIKGLDDPENKIRLEVRKAWRDKLEMRQWCTDRISGNWHMMLDGDEIWIGLDKWLAQRVPFTAPRWVNLWHGADHWIYDSPRLAGKRWGRKLEPYGSICPHYRWSWWRASYTWRRHPVLADCNGNALHKPNEIAKEKDPTCVIYHLGHALPPRIMDAKHKFYLRRDGSDAGRVARRDVWHKWAGETGETDDGVVQKVNWEIPEIIRRACARLKEASNGKGKKRKPGKRKKGGLSGVSGKRRSKPKEGSGGKKGGGVRGRDEDGATGVMAEGHEKGNNVGK